METRLVPVTRRCAPSIPFDVAVWRWWPSWDLPIVEVVSAPTAFEAVASVMQFCGWKIAGHAVAAALDRSLCYRAFGIRLAFSRMY